MIKNNFKFRKPKYDNEFLEMISDINEMDINSISNLFKNLFNNREYLYSKKYNKKFRISWLGQYNYINGVNNNIGDYLLNNYDKKYIIDIYNSMAWVTTDKYNADIGIDGNLKISLSEIKLGEWIPYKDYIKLKRNDIIEKILKKK